MISVFVCSHWVMWAIGKKFLQSLTIIRFATSLTNIVVIGFRVVQKQCYLSLNHFVR